MSNSRHQGESLLFFLPLSHSMTCFCLLNNHVVQHRKHAARRHTGRDEKSTLAVNSQTRNTLTHPSGWSECWESLSVYICTYARACVCVCVLIKSVRYQQSTIHQMNKYNRSNPAVILLLRLWCHDVIGNYSSATAKCVFGYRSDWSESKQQAENL